MKKIISITLTNDLIKKLKNSNFNTSKLIDTLLTNYFSKKS